jgi:hypothetical protein
VSTEFYKKIEHSFWHWPFKSAITTEFSTSDKSDEQNIAAGGVWRCRPKLVLPQPKSAAATELVSDHAKRSRSLTGERNKLEIGNNDLTKDIEGHKFSLVRSPARFAAQNFCDARVFSLSSGCGPRSITARMARSRMPPGMVPGSAGVAGAGGPDLCWYDRAVLTRAPANV